MVLKRCVYGVDKIPMAVELAKVSLWLHTFTVGAPLSFLDHHLRRGDSLFGEWVARAVQRTNEHSSLFLRDPLDRAMRAAAPMQIIEGLTDAEIAEAHRSSDIFSEVSEMTAPLHAFGVIWLSVTRFRGRYFLCFGGADRMAFASSSGMVGMDCWILRMSFVTGRPGRFVS